MISCPRSPWEGAELASKSLCVAPCGRGPQSSILVEAKEQLGHAGLPSRGRCRALPHSHPATCPTQAGLATGSDPVPLCLSQYLSNSLLPKTCFVPEQLKNQQTNPAPNSDPWAHIREEGLCRENGNPLQAMNTLPSCHVLGISTSVFCRAASGISQAGQMATRMGDMDGPAGQAGGLSCCTWQL